MLTCSLSAFAVFHVLLVMVYVITFPVWLGLLWSDEGHPQRLGLPSFFSSSLHSVVSVTRQCFPLKGWTREREWGERGVKELWDARWKYQREETEDKNWKEGMGMSLWMSMGRRGKLHESGLTVHQLNEPHSADKDDERNNDDSGGANGLLFIDAFSCSVRLFVWASERSFTRTSLYMRRSFAQGCINPRVNVKIHPRVCESVCMCIFAPVLVCTWV